MLDRVSFASLVAVLADDGDLNRLALDLHSVQLHVGFPFSSCKDMLGSASVELNYHRIKESIASVQSLADLLLFFIL